MTKLVLGTAIFVITYILIATEKFHRTLAAWAGAMLIVLLKILPAEEVFEVIDFNVIFLLVGMMIIVDITEDTGVFQWLQVRSIKLARGNPLLIMIMLCGLTAFLSAFLDNVTTIVLTVPLTFRIAASLGINPMPFLISQILASNIGGAATYIGDPPNILIGSAAKLGFDSFLVHLAPITVVIFGIFLFMLKFLFREDLRQAQESVKSVNLESFEEAVPELDLKLLRKSLVVLGLTILGFLLHEFLHLSISTVALSGAVLLMILAGPKNPPHERFMDIEWSTLFFFLGLFILVGGLVKIGLMEMMAKGSLNLVQGNSFLAAMLVLWISAIVSAFVDNIPFTAMMIPLISRLGDQLDVFPIWWALALGACLGGNATIIGASANVIGAGLCEKQGCPISFKSFLKYGLPVTLMSLLVSSLYIWLRYFVVK